MKEEIPSWLYFPLRGLEKSAQWTDEKERMARHIIDNIKFHFPDIQERLLRYEKHDTAQSYYQDPKPNEK